MEQAGGSFTGTETQEKDNPIPSNEDSKAALPKYLHC